MDKAWIQRKLGGMIGSRVTAQMNEINRLYDIYDGHGQNWAVAADLTYKPNRTVTNYVKKLIKAEARFMFSRPPEIKLVAEDSADTEHCQQIENWLIGVLDATRWRKKLIQAGRDCFIGKRVALKLCMDANRKLRVEFCPAQEFLYETMEDDTTRLKRICFFYQVAGEEEYDHKKQRIWWQRYELREGRCYLDEGLYDGDGNPVGEVMENQDTGLSFVPAYVILNDGLTGDTEGESDVETLMDNQHTYNRINSDDVDALRFSMFPIRYTIDVNEDSASHIEIAPNAYADLSSENAGDGKQAQFGMLESTFNYDARIENRLNRTKNDMHELLSVPNVSLEQLKGMTQSGKAMRGLYWDLTCRCEEKWAEGWDDAVRWMAESLIAMMRLSGAEALPECEYSIVIDHLYPIPDDEEEERSRDQDEVSAQVRSRRSYIDKWQPQADADGELEQIAREKKLLEDDFSGAI